MFIVCPVHWYQAPASLKLMIDRLVCADGGNADPTTTHGKNAELAIAHYEREDFVSADQVVPLYLRQSDAEINWDVRSA